MVKLPTIEARVLRLGLVHAAAFTIRILFTAFRFELLRVYARLIGTENPPLRVELACPLLRLNLGE